MSFYVYNDSVGVGRRYWHKDRVKWIMLHELPTLFDTEKDAENAIATYLMMHPGLISASVMGYVPKSKVGDLWKT